MVKATIGKKSSPLVDAPFMMLPPNTCHSASSSGSSGSIVAVGGADHVPVGGRRSQRVGRRDHSCHFNATDGQENSFYKVRQRTGVGRIFTQLVLTVASLLLLSSCGYPAVDAFAVTPPSKIAAPTAAGSTSSRPRVLRRVLILPDAWADVENPSLWHHHLKASILAATGVETSIEGMPDPFSFNTKRYETFWLNFMADELALCPGTLVVAHGTAADAVLRFVERSQIWGAALVCPGGEMYHAGERHGRAYVWPRVRRGCPWIAMVHGDKDPILGAAEARRVKEALGVPPHLFREVSGGERRLRDRTGVLPEVEQIVLHALSS